MKKSAMAKKLLKLLKTYENSALRQTEATQIIDFLQNQGMVPPCSSKANRVCYCGCGIRLERGFDWDPETRKK